MSEKHPDPSRTPALPGEFDMLTVKEVAAMLRVSRMTVYRLADSGVIDSRRVGRSIRLPRASVESFLRDAEQAQRHD
jgi:excisionase family DNA binding protein